MSDAATRPPLVLDDQGRPCRVVERAVFPTMSLAQAVHASNVDAGLAVLGLDPLPLPSGEIVRELLPV